MGELTKKEDDWLRKASSAAVAEARKVALDPDSGSLRITPVERITAAQWEWIINAAIFGWIAVRCQQAIAEGITQEQAVCTTGLPPTPCDVAVVHSVLPALCDEAKVDWAQPLSAWTKDAMTDFLLLAWQLIDQAEAARDRGAEAIVQRSDAAVPPAAPVVPSDLTISGVLTSLLNFGRFSQKDLTGEMPDPLDLIELAKDLSDVADVLKRQKQAAKSKALA